MTPANLPMSIYILQFLLLFVAALFTYFAYDAFMAECHNAAARRRWDLKTPADRKADAVLGHYGPSFQRCLFLRLLWWIVNIYYEVAGKALDCVDYLIDSYNLRQAGYRRRHLFFSNNKCWVKYAAPELHNDYLSWETFRTRAKALDHMREAMADAATREAIKARGSNFSGKSRNTPCPCGSGKKFKACCMIPD